MRTIADERKRMENVLKGLQASIENGSVRCSRYNGASFEFFTESGVFGVYLYFDNDEIDFVAAEDLEMEKFEVYLQ